MVIGGLEGQCNTLNNTKQIKYIYMPNKQETGTPHSKSAMECI
jgi:hypothetical protein